MTTKPDILKQKIGSLLSRIDNSEFLEGLHLHLKEQLEQEKRELLQQESLKKMHKRKGPTTRNK
jgi:hypothetical protein